MFEIPKIVIVIAACLALWLAVRWIVTRFGNPPLATDPDDPLLIAAVANARERLDEFRALLPENVGSALVKILFISNSGDVEHLSAEVLAISGDELELRLVTPPVTHRGRLEMLCRCKIDQIEDWHVRDAAGKLHGGFTTRAMIAIAYREGRVLPRQIAKYEREINGK